MTYTDLLIACGTGNMPKVKSRKPIRRSSSTIGQVTVIKKDGCAVRFPDMSWDTWFYSEHGEDGRKHYMSQLELA